MSKRPDDWQHYVLPHYSYVEFARGQRILDLGCGEGEQLVALRERGCVAIGIDPYWPTLLVCRRSGSTVAQAIAEALPLRTDSVDGVVCKGVIPYTDEPRAFSELARVLRDRGVAYCAYLGPGYYLRYLLVGPTWKHRVYGLRTLLNTWILRLTGKRLPGFLGDTVYQTRSVLAPLSPRVGFRLRRDTPAPRFMGLAVFIYRSVEKLRV